MNAGRGDEGRDDGKNTTLEVKRHHPCLDLKCVVSLLSVPA